MSWFVHLNGKQVGPWELDELTEAIRSGRVTSTTLVWYPGAKEWMPACNVSTLWSPPPLPDYPLIAKSPSPNPQAGSVQARDLSIAAPSSRSLIGTGAEVAFRFVAISLSCALVLGLIGVLKEETAAFIIGTAFGLLLIAMVAGAVVGIIAFFLFRADLNRITLGAIQISIIVGTALAYVGVAYKHQFNRSVSIYAPEGCQYTIAFPAPPELKDIIVLVGRYEPVVEQADLKVEDSLLRVICARLSVTPEEAKALLKRQAEAEGLQDVSISQKKSGAFESRGYKVVAGEQATYSNHVFLGTSSTLLVTVGSRSSQYPTSATHSFVNSVATR